MNKKEMSAFFITSAILLVLFFISTNQSWRPLIMHPMEDMKEDPFDMREALKPSLEMDQVKINKHISFPEFPDHSIVPENLSGDINGCINDLTDPHLSKIDRNRIEHMLGSSPDEDIENKIRMMLEDGLLELSEQSPSGMARLMSAIRIAGLRSDKRSVEYIIHICTHPETNENLRVLGYEALGYMEDETAKKYLRKELSLCQNGFLRSQIILSLGTARDKKCSQQILTYLGSQDPDLRDSAIIFLGKIREPRAVLIFKELYATTTKSSRTLILQALKEIGNSDAIKLRTKISRDPKKFAFSNDTYLPCRIRSRE